MMIRPRLRLVWVALCLPLCSLLAQSTSDSAQRNSTRPADPLELVYSASRYAQESREAPASVTIITAREIREYGYRTLADLLGSIRGLSTRNDLNYEYLTVRGLARKGDFNTRILVLVDGQRINSVASDAAYLGTAALLDLDRIDHVEVIRGPGSALFGTNAFNGVINIVTDRRTGEDGGTRVEVEGGQFGTVRGSAAWSTQRSNQREILVSASVLQRNGFDQYYPEFDAPATNYGIAKNLDRDATQRLFARGRLGAWSMETAYSHRSRTVPTASYETVFNAPEARTTDVTLMGSLGYARTFANLSRLSVSSAFSHVAYDGAYPYEESTLFDFDRATMLSLEAQYLHVFGRGHKLTVGGETRSSTDGALGAREVFVADAPDLISGTSRNDPVTAAFVQVEWRLLESMLLYTGIRHDRYADLGGTTNPRLGLVWNPLERTTLKALYGAAFRAPNLYERFFEDGISQKAPPGLAPEKLRSFEVEIEQRISGLIATASAYRIRTDSLINLIEDPADSLLVYINAGRPSARGVELELRGRTGRVSGRASWSVQRASDDAEDRRADSPTQLGRLGISMPFAADRANVAAELRHVGKRATLTDVYAPAFTHLNLTLLIRPNAQMELLFSVKDLLNTGRLDPGGAEHVQTLLRQDPRSLRAGLRIGF